MKAEVKFVTVFELLADVDGWQSEGFFSSAEVAEEYAFIHKSSYWEQSRIEQRNVVVIDGEIYLLAEQHTNGPHPSKITLKTVTPEERERCATAALSSMQRYMNTLPRAIRSILSSVETK